ncbi:MAG: TIGR01212 family radical SAM protein [Bacilli bacterium]|jgi:radical SAM protein (TIGR01212 family)|nr:TIGR01212 family radical SAM protein [Bacilli bacterium]
MEFQTKQHRFYNLDQYLKTKYKSKVFKVALNGNFNCPNRDGTISHLGCFFCSEKGSGDFAGRKEDALAVQFEKVSTKIHEKWPNAKYIAYFQANTNTYGPIAKLEQLFNEAIALHPDIVCLSIATRPDCINSEVLLLLKKLREKIEIWVELGLQTIHDNTALSFNRGYPTALFQNIVMQLHQIQVDVIVHIINGLPNESKNDMLETVFYLRNLPIQGIKIHSLFVQKNTIFGNQYQKNPFPLLTLQQYVDIVCEQIALLPSHIVIHRLSGDAPQRDLIAPEWTTKKLVVMNEIDKRMRLLQYFQGCKIKNDQI